MDKKYKGYDKEKNTWTVFTSNNPEDATPEASGYDEVISIESEIEALEERVGTINGVDSDEHYENERDNELSRQ
jgi:hypothetical protein